MRGEHLGDSRVTVAITERERVALLILTSAVCVAILLATTVESPSLVRVLDNLHWTLSYCTSAWMAWLGARGAHETDRGARRTLAAAFTAYAIGQCLWDVQVAVGWNPFPGPSDAFFVLLAPLTGVALVRLVAGRSNAAQRRLVLLDVLGLTIALLAMTLALYLPRRGDLTWLPMSVLVAYPVAFCAAFCIGLITTLALHLAPRRGWIALLGSLLINSGLWLRWNSLTLDEALADGSWFNALFSLNALFAGYGALKLRVETAEGERFRRTCDATLRLLPLAIVCMAAVATVLAYTLDGVPIVVRFIAWIGGAAVVVLASARQVVLVSDHEALIRKERSMREAEAAFRLMFELAGDAILITDRAGVVREANPRASSMLQRGRDVLIGSDLAEFVDAERREGFRELLAEPEDGAAHTKEWILRRGDGGVFSAEANVTAIPDGRLLFLVRDTSDRRALEGQLRQAQKMEAIGTLAAGIAHDFNNLITAISGNAELAALDLDPHHRAAQSLEEIQRASARAADLVRQIVAFSRPRNPTDALVRPAAIVDEVVRLLRSTIPAGVELRVRSDENAPTVRADSSQLHQVLVNLATNAWQAMDGRAGVIELGVESEFLDDRNSLGLPEGFYARITVRDDGTGMDAATRERVFEPFFTTKPLGEGTGLGLAVVHRIVLSHRGAIRVESEPGVGTTFSIHLPGVDGRVSSLAGVASVSGAPERSLRIVYVDDEASLVRMVERHLTAAGHSVRAYTSAEDALAALRRDLRGFDIVVTDYNMPVMSGWDLVVSVREDRPDVPVIITSGFVDRKLLDRAASVPHVKVLEKPYRIADLHRAIDELCAELRAPAQAVERRGA